MLSTIFTAAVLLTSFANAAPTAYVSKPETESEIAARGVQCHKGVYAISARGSNSPQWNNAAYSVAQAAAALEPDSVAYDLDYPAGDPANQPAYQASVTQGVYSLKNAIRTYVDACPYHQIALIGYSQGAQVVSQTLIGTANDDDGIDALPGKYRFAIAAVVTYGDPFFMPGLSTDRGTAFTQGMIGRTNAYLYNALGMSKKLISYCDAGDPVCSNGYDWFAHTSYFPKYDNDAVSFIKSKLINFL